MFDKNLSHKLRVLRETHNLTQQEIATILNVNRATYTYYETGKTQPSLQSIVKLAELYKISTDDILLK